VALRVLLAAALLSSAAWLRLGDLDRRGLGDAELRAVAVAAAPGADFLERVRARPGATPLAYAALREGLEWGWREIPVRLPFALAGALAVGAAFLLLQDLFGVAVAAAAAAVFAVSPLAVDTSRQALASGFALPFAFAWAWLLWRVLRRGAGVAAAAAAGVVALYAGYAALAVALAALVTAAVTTLARRAPAAAARRTVAVVGCALLGFAPWALYDLPTEPGRDFVPPPDLWSIAASLPTSLLFDAAPPSPFAAGAAAAIAALALLGLAFGLRQREPAVLYAAALALFAPLGALTAAHLGPQPFTLDSVLLAAPAYLGLAFFGLASLVGLAPLPRLAAVATVAGGLLVAGLEWDRVQALAAQPARLDWRSAFQVVLANLGAEDRVAAPLATDATAFYGRELLARRLPRRDRIQFVQPWLQQSRRGWLIAGPAARAHPDWGDARTFVEQFRFAVPLGATDEPLVLYLGERRRPTWRAACAFELPAAVVARGTFLRDCLVEVGPDEGPLRQVTVLANSHQVSLANPSLLEAAQLLEDAGQVEAAGSLRAAIAARRQP